MPGTTTVDRLLARWRHSMPRSFRKLVEGVAGWEIPRAVAGVFGRLHDTLVDGGLGSMYILRAPLGSYSMGSFKLSVTAPRDVLVDAGSVIETQDRRRYVVVTPTPVAQGTSEVVFPVRGEFYGPEYDIVDGDAYDLEGASLLLRDPATLSILDGVSVAVSVVELSCAGGTPPVLEALAADRGVGAPSGGGAERDRETVWRRPDGVTHNNLFKAANDILWAEPIELGGLSPADITAVSLYSPHEMGCAIGDDACTDDNDSFVSGQPPLLVVILPNLPAQDEDGCISGQATVGLSDVGHVDAVLLWLRTDLVESLRRLAAAAVDVEAFVGPPLGWHEPVVGRG